MLIFGKLCRLCTTDKDLASTLNNFDSDNIILLDKLNLIAPELLNVNSSLPNGICKTCIAQLNQAYTFIKKCVCSQEILNQYLKQLQNGQNIEQCTNLKIVVNNIINYDNISENAVKISNLLHTEYVYKSDSVEQENIIEDNDGSGFTQVNFEDKLKVEGIDMNQFVPNEIVSEGCNNSIDIQTTTSVKNEVECLIDFKNETIEECLCETNINDYKSTVVKYEDEITIEKHEIESCLTDLHTITEQSYVCKNNSIDFSSQVNFEDEIKVEEIDTNHFLPNDKTEIITEGCNNSVDIQTTASVKEELEFLIEDTIDFKNETIEEQRLCETNINDYESTIVKYEDEITIEKHEIKSSLTDLPTTIEQNEFYGFHSIDYSLANKFQVKYDVILKRFCDNTNKFLSDFQNNIIEKQANETNDAIYLENSRTDKHMKEDVGNLEDIAVNRTLKNSTNVKVNIRTRAIKAPHKTKTGKKTHQNQSKLTRQICKDKKRHECKLCGKGFRTVSELTIHIRSHKGEKPYPCKICNKNFTNKTDLKRHILIHTGEKPFHCQTCKKSFNQKIHLTTHLLTHSGEKPFHCQTCEKTFARKGDLKIHIRTHSGEKPYHCQTCKKIFAQKIHLTTHIQTHSGEKPFHCQTCEKTFARKGDLKIHIRTHSGEKPYHCQTCEKTFARKGDLKIHIRTHSGEKPYHCQTCKKTFAQKIHLTTHIQTHSGEKSFHCQTCKKTFAQKIHLTTHIQTHSGEKPFHCQTCKKTFTRKADLTRHIRTHSGDNPFHCQTCKKTFTAKSSLNRHIRTHITE